MTDKERIIVNGKGCRYKTWDAECSLTGDHYGDNMKPCKFIDEKSCYFKQLTRKTQIIDDVEEVIKPYQEQIELDALSLPIAIESILERKTQECEELKIQLMQKDEVDMFFNTPIEGWSSDPCNICESKNNYEQLKQECEELKEKLYQIEDVVKPINEQLPEDNVIRQIMLILNDCNKLEPSRYRKALEEIEEILKDEICEECPGKEGCKAGCKEHQCLDIINKAKGKNNE